MLRIPLVSTFLVLLFLSSVPSAGALEVPERPEGYVTDRAGVLSSQTKSRLEAYLTAYERETTNQVVVAVFPSLEGEAVEDFSIRLAERWKVGQTGKDNGVIFLVFLNDRLMRIEAGYGLEGVLPDALAGQIISQVVVPYFRQDEIEQGIVAGVAAIVRATEGEFKAAESRAPPPYQRPLTPAELEAMRAQGKAMGILILVLVAVFCVVDFFRYGKYIRGHGGYTQRYTFWEWWFRFAVLLFVLNIVFRMMFYAMLFSRGGYYGGRGGFGGFSGGGGAFGGGGASGRW